MHDNFCLVLFFAVYMSRNTQHNKINTWQVLWLTAVLPLLVHLSYSEMSQ